MKVGLLGDNAEILSGFAFKSENFNSDKQGMPLIRIRDVVPGETSTYYDGSYEDRFVVHRSEILIGMDGDFNRARWKGHPALLNQRVCKIKAHSQLHEGYLFHLLPEILQVINDRTAFVTVKHLSTKDLREVEIPLPPLDEQKRIAAILDQADALRRLRTRALDRLNALGQAIFHEMFGDDTNTEELHLSEIAELINGDRSSNYPSGEDIKAEGILFLSTKNIRDWRLALDNCQFITQEKFGSLSRGKLRRGDVIITLRGTLGQAAIFDCNQETGFINAQMMIIRPKIGISSQYLLDFIALDSTQSKLMQGQTGSAVRQLTAAHVGELLVKVPSQDQQAKYGDRTQALQSLAERLKIAAVRSETLFTSLQHRAFRGEL